MHDQPASSPAPVATHAASPRPLLHLLVLGALFVPLACIPYIPIRRHLLSLGQAIHTLSANTLALHHELNTTLLHARLRKEEAVKLTEQLRALQSQLDTASRRTTDAEGARRNAENALAKRLDAVAERTAQAEGARLRAEEALKRQVDSVKRCAERDRLPPELLADVSVSLADMASFMEEVEIQGLSQSIPRDHGIDRMRQLALKLHTMAKTRHSQPPNDTQR